MNERERIRSYLRSHPRATTPEIGEAIYEGRAGYSTPANQLAYRILKKMWRDGEVMKEYTHPVGSRTTVCCVWTLTEGRE